MAVTIKGKPATKAEKVTVKDNHSGVEKTLYEMSINGSPEVANAPMATVGFSAGLTKNLGNYSSARVDVSLTIPCTTGTIDNTFQEVVEWVNARMEEIIEDQLGSEE